MRGGGGENQRITFLGKELRQISTQAVLIGHLVAFINDDNVPMGLFEPCTEAAIVLQRINRNYRLVVIVKWILVHGNLTLNLRHAYTVQTDERNGKTVPDFFLELGKDALQSAHKDALAATTTNHLTEEDAHLDCLTETYAISDKQTRTRQFHCFQGGLHLVFCYIVCATLGNSNLMREKSIASYSCLNK